MPDRTFDPYFISVTMPDDAFEFEPVSIEEARKVLDGPGAAPESRPPELRRAPLDPAEAVLSDAAIAWLARLPADVRPEHLPRVFPRIANRMAQVWPSPTLCEDYLRSLTVSDRPGRQGFPPDVMREIGSLAGFRFPPDEHHALELFSFVPSSPRSTPDSK